VEHARVDVTRAEEVAALFARIDEALPPLKGVIHAAGVLESRRLADMEGAHWARVTAPKIDGAWALHQALGDRPLELCVLFSSAWSLLGPIGGGAYAAGNAFLDALAHHGGARGLAAVSIDWGVWSSRGMAGGEPDDERVRRAEQMGLGAITPRHGLR